MRLVVVLQDLPKLPANRTWQLWMMDASQKARSIGLTSGDVATVIQGGVVGQTTFGLTEEPAGGSPAPTTTPVAAFAMT